MKDRICLDCGKAHYDCFCVGADRFKANPLKSKLEAWGISDPKAFIAQCVKHGRVHVAKPDPMRLSQK